MLNLFEKSRVKGLGIQAPKYFSLLVSNSHRKLLSEKMFLPILTTRTGGTYVRNVNPLPNFDFFISNCYYSTYEVDIFGKLADNGFSGCRRVVGADG